MGFKLVCGCLRNQKVSRKRVYKKTWKKLSQQKYQHLLKYAPKKFTKVVFLCVFLSPHPSMVPRASPGRLPEPKAYWSGGQHVDFLKFNVYDSTLFEHTLKIFRVFHEQQIDSTRCSVYGSRCLGWGENLQWMPPRCLSDASQFPPNLRCVADALAEISLLIWTFDAKIIRKLKWKTFEI
jgi:hypothetical protein